MSISDRFARRTDSAPRTTGHRARPAKFLRGTIAAGAVAALGAAALAGAAAAHAATGTGAPAAPAATGGGYQFVTLGDHRDVTFNQLLGINDYGKIAAYFGSGAQGHPNKGYILTAPYAQNDIANENYPHSRQTQVTGLNDRGVTVGFYSTQNTASGTNNNFGFYHMNGHFHAVNFPTGDNAKPPVNQLLGVNNSDVAVGFYTNGGGSNRGYTYNIRTHRFTRIQIPGYPGGVAGPSTTAAGINNHGDVTGFYVNKAGVTVSFLDRHGHFTTFAFRGASATTATGVNDHDEVVGVYTVGTGGSAATHGFTWTPRGGFVTVDDPNGAGTTVLNGINDEGDLVGFYTDSAGNTDGLLAFPAF